MISYYRCKECGSHGNIPSHKNQCPVCGSRYLKFYKSEYDYVQKGGVYYEKCNES